MIRKLIQEILLAERVYGSQAVVYHGSKAPPDVFVPALLNDTFEPGQGEGAMYGKGLYCVYDLSKTQTESGAYGNYVYKFKVNLYGFICFDPEVAQLVYKRPLTPVEQAQELGLDEVLVEKLRKINVEVSEFTSNLALPASKFLKGKVKGLIFTGSRDGQVAVVYDQAIAVPFAWKRVSDESWTVIDKSLLKSALKRSASGDWKAEKYDIDPITLLARLSKLPVDKRVVKGNIDLSYTEITSLPVGLHVGGNLWLMGMGITSLPAGLQVDGDLGIAGTKITSLPVGLHVGGDLNLRGLQITSLPAGLQVGGELNLEYTKITSLPADLKVGGELNVIGAGITSLPDGFQIGGNLYLDNTKITSLPAGLQVGGTLSLSKTEVTLIPADLKVGGSLYLDRTKITSLPAGLQVGGNLDLRGTGITSLPAGLQVGGTLSLVSLEIMSLPADLQVGGEIFGFYGDRSQVSSRLDARIPPPPPPSPLPPPPPPSPLPPPPPPSPLPPPPPPSPLPPPPGSSKDAMAAWKAKYGPKPLPELRMLRRLIKDYL